MGVYRSDVFLGGARKAISGARQHRLDEPTGLSLGMVASLQWDTRPVVWTIREGTVGLRWRCPKRRQLRPRAHWCLSSPTCSVVLDPVFNTVMTYAIRRIVEDLVWETTFDCTVRADARGQKRITNAQEANQVCQPSNRRTQCRRNRYWRDPGFRSSSPRV